MYGMSQTGKKGREIRATSICYSNEFESANLIRFSLEAAIESGTHADDFFPRSAAESDLCVSESVKIKLKEWRNRADERGEAGGLGDLQAKCK